MVIMTALHFASTLAQGDDCGEPPLSWLSDCPPPFPHLKPQVPQHPQTCLWSLTGSDEGRGGGNATGRGLPLTLSPEDGSSSSPAESEAGRWQQSGKVSGGPDTDPRLAPGVKIVCPSGWLDLVTARRWERSLFLDLGGGTLSGLGADPGNRTPCLRGVWSRSQADAPVRSTRRSVFSRTMQGHR